MEAFTKWIGNKGQYLDGILPLVPCDIEHYYDVFVGGGSLYLGIPDCRRFVVAHTCRPLIDLYREVQLGEPVFLSHLREINASWLNIEKLCEENAEAFRKIYQNFPEGKDYDYLLYVKCLNSELAKIEYDRVFLQHYSDPMLFELEKRYHFTRRKAQSKKWKLKTPEAIDKYIQTALKTALYEYYVELYNACPPLPVPLKKAILLFLLQFSSKGDFKYEGKREFRPTYAGTQHDNLTLESTIRLLESEEFKQRLAKTEFHCQDFSKFFERRHPGPRDLVLVNLPSGLNEQDTAGLLALLKRRKSLRFMLLVRRSDITPTVGIFSKDYHITLLGPGQELMVVTNYTPKGI